jgi:hypothetical protein
MEQKVCSIEREGRSIERKARSIRQFAKAANWIGVDRTIRAHRRLSYSSAVPPIHSKPCHCEAASPPPVLSPVEGWQSPSYKEEIAALRCASFAMTLNLGILFL